MSEWLDNQKQSTSTLHKLLHKRNEAVNPRRKLTSEETKRLSKLEGIADKLRRGENVQNRQLKTWLSEEEYEQRKNAVFEDERQRLMRYLFNATDRNLPPPPQIYAYRFEKR